MIIYVTQPGDSLYSISKKYDVPLSQLMSDNGAEDLMFLPVGLALIINNDVQNYTVRPGQSIYSIARAFGLTPEEILTINPQLETPDSIRPGDVIKIPVQTEKLGKIYANGYAYTSISPQTLRKTLPSLTYISPFSYEVSADGSLSALPDRSVIETARASSVAPMMTLTNLKPDGGFDSEIMAPLVRENSEAFFNNVLSVMNDKNYYGVNVDFEYIPKSLREEYNAFLQEFTNKMRENGYYVIAALAPKIRKDQPGILYEGHDYGAVGAIVDKVILMTYEWGYTYGPPRAVAPLNEVERVIRYAQTEMPKEKIMMSIPNYGYDWTLPYVPGTPARAISNRAAVMLASRYGADIEFDETAKAPYFYYEDDGGAEHIVWFEDARSIEAKLGLIDKYSLAGVSYWTVNAYFSQMYIVQNYMFDTIKLV